MLAKEFIQKQLTELVEIAPYIKCLYEIDEFDNTHYIKVLPKSYYEYDEKYLQKEIEITDAFVEKFPYEGISFITEGDPIDVKNPIFIAKGFLYELTEKAIEFNFADFELFKDFVPEFINTNIHINDNLISFEKNVHNFFDKITSQFVEHESFFTYTYYETQKNESDNGEIEEENDFSLAA